MVRPGMAGACVPSRIAGETGCGANPMHDRAAAQQLSGRQEGPLVIGDGRLAERHPVHREVIPADATGFVWLGAEAPEGVGQCGGDLIAQSCDLRRAEQPAQRQVPEVAEVEDLLVRKNEAEGLCRLVMAGREPGQEVHEQLRFIDACRQHNQARPTSAARPRL
jgi:hypothetical protein